MSGVAMENLTSLQVFSIRQNLGMTTSEAGTLVNVTKRTWEKWESGQSIMPISKQELLTYKLKYNEGNYPDNIEIVSIVDKTNAVVIDAISNENFCGLENNNNGTHTIKSLAIDRFTKRPYIYKTVFFDSTNHHVFPYIEKWISAIDR
jgi:DNA-binding XRE family transcriptional regulator